MTGTVLQVTSTGRVRLPQAGLDLVAVGLTSDEARGCAALIAAGENLNDQPIPNDGHARRTGGAPTPTPPVPYAASTPFPATPLLRTSSATRRACCPGPTRTTPPTPPPPRRTSPTSPRRFPPASVRTYRTPTPTSTPTSWPGSPTTAHYPRLTLLGPVKARTRGTPLALRKPYMTAVLAYLCTRPHGATPDELADAMNVSVGKARDYAKVIREWLGTNPRTGDPHLPDARRAPAAQARGIGVYQVQDLLVDADLFRRLRVRGQARGADGLPDLVRALDLVQGPPFSQVRADAWSWLYEGDRLDHHLTCAVVDVAHLVITHALRSGDTPTARAAVETALRAAPAEEVARLDLAAVGHADGRREEMQRFLRAEVFNRTDDDGPPPDLPARTQTHRRRTWLGQERQGSRIAAGTPEGSTPGLVLQRPPPSGSTPARSDADDARSPTRVCPRQPA